MDSKLDYCTNFVGNHKTLSFAIIVILTILVIYIMVYYRGLWGFGPLNKENLANSSANPKIDTVIKNIEKAFKTDD